MIISGPRKKFDLATGRIELPVWLRAPLFLNKSAKLWGVYHKPDQLRSVGTMEVVVAPIAPRHWRDVWRLEITTEDRPGNLALMYEILRESGIEVLFSEGSMHSFAKFHSMTFILSLIGYDNHCDGGTDDRADEVLPSVPGLETVIQTAFLDQLVFEKSGEPRFLLKRLNLYKLMASDRLENQKLLPESGIEIDRKGSFRPDDACLGNIRSLAGKSRGGIEYAPAVDTDFRCIRILFFPTNDMGPGHLQFLASHMTIQALDRITSVVHAAGGNIIRLQLRPGLPKAPVGKLHRLKFNTDNAEQSPARFDLTIEPTGGGGTTKDLLFQIEQTVQADQLLKQLGVDIQVPLRQRPTRPKKPSPRKTSRRMK